MGSVDRCDPTLPPNELMFCVRLVMALTRGPAEVLAYMPSVAWRTGTGTGMVAWSDLAA